MTLSRSWPVPAAARAGELLRFSHENSDVKALYKDYLGAPLGEKSHHLLHTDHNAWQMPQKML